MNVPHEGCKPSGKDSAVSVPCILGDCTIQLSHATTYEPPFYLFPELLEKVPQGTPPLRVWDAVADVLDVPNSSWRIADVQALATSSAVSKRSGEGPNKDSSRSTAVHTLASLISSNRLLQAGLSPSVLLKGNFSAAKMLEELVQLKTRAGLDEQEGAVIMTNHFINLLAWRKLHDINHGAAMVSDSTRKRARSSAEAEEEEEGEGAEEERPDCMRPCPHPWSDEVDDPSRAGLFVSGREENVERKVELLETLSRLYQRSWRQLRSQGCQTDYVVPPGTVNVTSPFVNGQGEGGGGGKATLDLIEDLGWGPRSGANSPYYAVRIRSSTLRGVGEQRVDLEPTSFATTAPAPTAVLFGRASGVQYGIAGNPVCVDVGLGAFTSNPQTLSTLHFGLFLRPMTGKKGQEEGASAPLGTLSNDATSDHPSDDENSKTSVAKGSVVTNPLTLGSTVWIMNYGRNGISIIPGALPVSGTANDEASLGRPSRWVNGGDALQLHVGDEIVVGGGEVHVTLITTQDENDTLDTNVSRVKDEGEALLSAVKKENNLDENES